MIMCIYLMPRYIDKEERVLSIARDIEVFIGQVKRDRLGKIENFLKFSHFDD